MSIASRRSRGASDFHASAARCIRLPGAGLISVFFLRRGPGYVNLVGKDLQILFHCFLLVEAPGRGKKSKGGISVALGAQVLGEFRHVVDVLAAASDSEGLHGSELLFTEADWQQVQSLVQLAQLPETQAVTSDHGRSEVRR